jgi:hypothetical protein
VLQTGRCLQTLKNEQFVMIVMLGSVALPEGSGIVLLTQVEFPEGMTGVTGMDGTTTGVITSHLRL